MTKHNIFFLLAILILSHCATADVDDVNSAPVANLGPDFGIELGQVVKLNGDLSFDKNNDTLTYRWELEAPNGSEAVLKSTNFVETEFSVDVPGTYVVSLIVNDGSVDSAPDRLSMKTTGDENLKPRAVLASIPKTIPFGSAIMFDGSNSSDPEGKAITFDWQIDGAPEGSIAKFDSRKIPKPTLLPDVPGEYEVSLVVEDDLSESKPVSLIFAVAMPENEPPVADAGTDQEIGLGDTVQLDATNSSDKEGATLTYSWEMKSRPATSTAIISDRFVSNPTFTADLLGSYRIELVVSDGESSSEPVAINIEAKQGNLAPTANAGANSTVVQGVQIFLDGSASRDPESASLTYLWGIITKPTGSNAMIADPTLRLAPFTADLPGIYEFSLVVNDGLVDSAIDSVRLTVEVVNSAPTANAGADLSENVGQAISLDGTNSSDADGDLLTYSWNWAEKPSGSNVSFDDATSATPVFTPDLGGTYRISLTVSDAMMSSMPDEIVVTVRHFAPTNEGDLVITEIMANPDALSDAVGEWFELYNPTNTTFELENCTISDFGSDSHVIQQSLIVAPLSYVTLARTGTPGFTPDYVWSSFSLSNASDEILLECAGNEISNILIDNSFNVPTGASLSLLDSKRNETDNDVGANWCTSLVAMTNGDFGTPGMANMFAGTSCP